MVFNHLAWYTEALAVAYGMSKIMLFDRQYYFCSPNRHYLVGTISSRIPGHPSRVYLT